MTVHITEEARDEHTPLLPRQDGEVQQKHDDVYNRFTKAQKRRITALIAIAGLCPRESCSHFCSTSASMSRANLNKPCYLAISAHIRVVYPIHTSDSKRSGHDRFCSEVSGPTLSSLGRNSLRLGNSISLAVSLSIVTNAIGGLLWASYSSYCKL